MWLKKYDAHIPYCGGVRTTALISRQKFKNAFLNVDQKTNEKAHC